LFPGHQSGLGHKVHGISPATKPEKKSPPSKRARAKVDLNVVGWRQDTDIANVLKRRKGTSREGDSTKVRCFRFRDSKKAEAQTHAFILHLEFKSANVCLPAI
jgi:hypothetical protein